MINVTAQELERILSVIDKALLMHEQWRERLERSLICKLPPEAANMAYDAHHQCAFGQWYYSAENAHLRKLESFRKVEVLHETMHALARDLCTHIKGHWAITPKEYDPFANQITVFRKELLKLRKKVEDTLHTIDALTGAYTSGQLLPELRREQEAQKTSGHPYSLLLLRFDLDQVNRDHGQDKGDAILRASLAAIRQALGREDLVYRYSGVEFVICLPGKTPEQAHEVRQSLLDVIGRELTKSVGEITADLPVHYGIVELEPNSYIEQVMKQAARAAYIIRL
jgi:diguanylate cyclase